MTTKLLVIIASGDRDVVLTAMMYARNTVALEWIPDLKVIFFGPSENLLVDDEEVRREAMNLAEVCDLGETVACKFLSDRDEKSEQIEKLGITVDYVGTIIANLLKEGYTPMVW
ncbi:MAG: hypothetical protein ACW99U_13820 [Candidatus Thorarchaeota archaeon]